MVGTANSFRCLYRCTVLRTSHLADPEASFVVSNLHRPGRERAEISRRRANRPASPSGILGCRTIARLWLFADGAHAVWPESRSLDGSSASSFTGPGPDIGSASRLAQTSDQTYLHSIHPRSRIVPHYRCQCHGQRHDLVRHDLHRLMDQQRLSVEWHRRATGRLVDGRA